MAPEGNVGEKITYSIEQAIKLKPRYLTMIVPSRWFTGGKNLGGFREKMLADNSLRIIKNDKFSIEYKKEKPCIGNTMYPVLFARV